MTLGVTGTVLRDVHLERMSQDNKWGQQNHELPYWIGILGEEFGEVCKEVIEYKPLAEVREEAIQVAAVAVAMIEYIDRRMQRDEVH